MSVYPQFYCQHNLNLNTLDEAITDLKRILGNQLIISELNFGPLEKNLDLQKQQKSFADCTFYLCDQPFLEFNYNRNKEIWLLTDHEAVRKITIYPKAFQLVHKNIPRFISSVLLHFNTYHDREDWQIELCEHHKENWSNLLGFTKQITQKLEGSESIIIPESGYFQNASGFFSKGKSISEVIADFKKISQPVFTSSALPKKPESNSWPEEWQNVWTIIY